MKRILVVEDVRDINQLISDILQLEGYEILQCYNGSEAINILRSDNKFDLVISDIIMPEGDGFDLMTFIKAQKMTMPTLVISGGGIALSSAVALEAIKKDATAVLHKPIKRQVLIETIQTLLGERAAG